MNPKLFGTIRAQKFLSCLIAILCTALLLPSNVRAIGRRAQQTATQETVKIPPAQLDALVSPIALYPDNLLSQTLVASTYPLEIIQLQQWLEKNKKLKDAALIDAVKNQPWDPSIQAMAVLPEVIKRLADDIQWTTDLGNAFLAQQSDVMDSVQRMRLKAQSTGALKSTQQQKVETQVVESKTVIVVEQANPQVVYVPSYNPTVVYGPPVYPYPPIYYPPYPTGAVVAASAVSFGVGLAVGAAWGGGGWGWGCAWGHNDINVNINNTFNRNANINRNTNISSANTWQHNPQHRGGAPYGDRTTANKFGGTARGDSLTTRQQSAQQQLSRQRGNLSSVDRTGGERVSNRGTAPVSERSTGTANRAGTASDRSAGAANRGGAGLSDRSTGVAGVAGGDRVGNRSLSGSYAGEARNSGFGSGSGSFSGANARSSSSRGASSMGSAGGSLGGGRSIGGGRRRG